MQLLDLITGPWAVLPETLCEMQDIYATHLRGEKIDIAAIEARLGRPLASEQQQYQILPGGVAVLRASGVMAPKANLFMQVSGGISTQMLTRQFGGMLADDRVRSVVFAPDSPGGNVLGVPAAARALALLAQHKPTVTVGEGIIASAMYWVASAANAMYIEGETDMVGSLGVIKTLQWEPAQPNQRTLVRGKYKAIGVNGAEPTPEQLAHHEGQLDYLYTLLVDNVAAHRGTTSATVLDRMADGRVFVGRQAMDAGLVDGVATVDAMAEALATNPGAYATRRKAVFALAARPPTPVSASAGAAPQDDIPPTATKGPVMPTPDTQAPISRESLASDHPSLFASLQADFTAAGATAERSRIQGVLAQGALLPGHDALVQTLAFDGSTTPEQAAMALLAAEGQARSAAAQAHFADAPAAAPPSALPDSGAHSAAGAGADAASASATASLTIARRAVALMQQLRNPTPATHHQGA